MQTNYSLSLWIANLGVVPLFSLAFFLFLPALLSFSFLLVCVFIVLEPMAISLSYRINNKLRKKFLSFSSQVVKVFIALCIAKTVSANTDLFLAKGEQTELAVKSLKSFSVGNPEVIKYKYIPSKNEILLKGNGLGFSDIIIWNTQGQKQIYHIYVTSKKSQLKQMQLLKALEKTTLKTLVSGEFVQIQGEIKNLSDYLIVKNLQNTKLENVVFNVQLETKLKNKIIAEIYRDLYQQGVKFVRCFQQQIDLYCEYDDPTKQAHLDVLARKYFITFTQRVNQHLHQNYELEFKIVALENNQQSEYTPGMDRIEFNLKNAIEQKQIDLSSENFLIQQEDYSAHLVANPSIRTIVDKNFKLTLGSEIPFQQVVNNQINTSWKFAGLELNGKISITQGKLALELHSQITTPGDNQISGPTGEAVSYITPGETQQFFAIHLNNKFQDRDFIPLVKDIPLLKDLFTSTSDHFVNKKILCFVTLKELPIHGP